MTSRLQQLKEIEEYLATMHWYKEKISEFKRILSQHIRLVFFINHASLSKRLKTVSSTACIVISTHGWLLKYLAGERSPASRFLQLPRGVLLLDESNTQSRATALALVSGFKEAPRHIFTCAVPCV
jgi:hypothetical protein